MNHEKLRCYKLLASIAEEVARMMSSWPRGNFHLEDQLSRAMTSSILNLSEGNGRCRYGKERRRFFRISLGSIAESSSCLDIACMLGLIPQKEQLMLKSRLRTAYKMIEALP